MTSLFVCGTLTGCATVPSSLNPNAAADAIARGAGFEKCLVSAGIFDLRAYTRITRPGEPLTIYLEGDGLAWKGRNRISGDPTPLHSLALRLASLDPSENVVYLARPGQYLRGTAARPCDPTYWTDRRFSEEVIEAMKVAVDQLKNEAGASRVDLVGYSGGAAVAVLVADRRKDVRSIRTIAGNLDPGEVNRLHAVDPLAAGPDPMDAAARLAGVPQRHFTGSRDTTVPGVIAERFKGVSGDSPCVEVVRVDGASHGDGWLKIREKLLVIPPDCGKPDRFVV